MEACDMGLNCSKRDLGNTSSFQARVMISAEVAGLNEWGHELYRNSIILLRLRPELRLGTARLDIGRTLKN